MTRRIILNCDKCGAEIVSEQQIGMEYMNSDRHDMPDAILCIECLSIGKSIFRVKNNNNYRYLTDWISKHIDMIDFNSYGQDTTIGDFKKICESMWLAEWAHNTKDYDSGKVF